MAESNLIEVLIKSVDQASSQLADIEKRLAGIEAQTKKTSEATDALTSIWAKAGAAVVVLNQGLEFLNKIFEPTLAHFEKGIQLAGQFQQESATLGSTLQVLGKNIPVQNLIDFSEEMAKANGVSSESVLAAEKQLVSLTKLNEQGIKKVIEGSLALSKVTDIDFGTAIRRSIALLEGNTTQIMRGKDAINQHIPLVERAAALQRYYSTFIEAASKSTDTYQRTQKTLNNAIEDFHKALGAGIIQQLQTVNSELTKYVDYATEIVKAHPQLITGIYGVAKALDELKGVLIAIAALQMTGALGFLGRLIANPAALAALGTVALIAAGGFAILNKEFERSADIDAAKNFDDAGARITVLTEKLAKLKAQQQESLKNQIDPRLKADIEDTQASIDKLLAAQRSLTIRGEVDTGPTSHEAAALPETLSKEEEETRRIIEKVQADIIKGRADAKASFEQFLFETTGDFNAQARAFAATQAGIAASTKASVDQQMKALLEQNNFDPAQQARIRGALTAQASLQIQASQLQARKAAYDNEQQAIKLNLTLQQSISEQIGAQAAVEERRLGVLKDQNATLGEQADQEKRASQFRLDEHLKNIQILEEDQQRLEKEEKFGNLRRQWLDDLQKITNKLIAEKDAVDAIADTEAKIAKERREQIVSSVVRERQGFLAAQTEADAARLDALKDQLDILKEQQRPYGEILAVTTQIDAIERSQLLTAIKKKEIELDVLKAKREQLKESPEAPTPGEIAAGEAELERLRKSLSFTGVGGRKLAADLHQQAEQMASDVAGSFVDTFVQFLSNSDAKIADVFASLGKTIMSEFLRAAIATLLAKPFEEILKDWSTSAPNTAQAFTKFGFGGAGFGGILDLLGIGKKGMPQGFGARPEGVEGPSLPGGFFTDASQATQEGIQNLDKSMTEGLSDLFNKSVSGFGDFFTSLASLISNALSAMSKGGGSMVSGILGIFSSVAGLFSASMPTGYGLAPAGVEGPSLPGGFFSNPNYASAAVTQSYSLPQALPQAFLQPFQQSAAPTSKAIAASANQPVTMEQQPVSVIVNGNIAPNPPNLTPDQVIKIVYNDADRGGVTSKAITSVIKRTR